MANHKKIDSKHKQVALLRLEELEKDFNVLSQTYQASARQRRVSLEAGQQVKLEQDIKETDEKLEELAGQIDKLRHDLGEWDDTVYFVPDEREIFDRIEKSEAAVVNIADQLNPYKGLEAFTEKDAVNFFGRERDCNDVINKIKAKNHTMVTGSSGNGKSSLVMAGVLPRLREEGWLVAIMTPGDDPNLQLVSNLRDFSAKSSEIVNQFGSNIGHGSN